MAGVRTMSSVLLSLLLAAVAQSASLPSFASNNIDPSQTAASVYVQDHWSETVTLNRPDLSKTDFNNSQRVNCAYSAQGLKRWSDSSIWPNSAVPAANTWTSISIPDGVSVLVAAGDLSSSVYGYITIPATSKLIFADADITLSTLGIIVQGSLTIGTETCPLSSKVKIVLYGSKPTTLPASPSVKGIHVTGRLDIFGVIYAPTWTRLARTASAGDRLIYLQDIVNWEVGQTVMITTTNFKDSLEFHRNDVATIESVFKAPHLGPRISVVKLTAGLKYKHYADTEYQAEVAMLSRRIVIMGDDSSGDSSSSSDGCVDPDNKSVHPCWFISGYGGHVMIDKTGIGKVQGVEFYHMGQTNVMARYPYHFHMLGENGKYSSISFSSIHQSFYRGVAVHGSNHTVLSNNVAFNITGNCYYIEDGVEEDNLFEYNLGAFVHVMALTQQSRYWVQTMDTVKASSNLVVPTDLAASPFYITNPANKFIGNAASGGWSGFAFVGLPKPIQMHKDTVMLVNPVSKPLIQFEGNSAHSTGHWWANAAAIYIGGLLQYDSNGNLEYNPGRINTGRDTCLGPLGPYGCEKKDLTWLRLNNTKTFLAHRGVMDWGPRTEIVRYESHDCGKAANVFGAAWVDKMLSYCRTRNIPEKYNGCQSANWWECAPRDWASWSSYVGFEWYDVGQSHIVTNVTFRNCDGNWDQCIDGKCDSTPWNFLTHSDEFVPEHMQATKNVIYQNCDSTRLWKFSVRNLGYTVSGRLQSWRDTDGTASLRNVPTQMGSNWGLDWWKLSDNNCVAAPGQMDFWECDYPTATASMLLQADFDQSATVGVSQCGNGNGIPCPTLGYVNHIYRPSLKNGLVLTANPKATGIVDDILGGGWYIRWLAGAPKSLTITNIQLMKSDGSPGASMLVAVPYPAGTTFTVTGKAADWCYVSDTNLCTHVYQKMTSLTALRALKTFDGYFWDSNINVLYVWVVEMNYGSLGPGTWQPGQVPESSFTRAGITLVGISQFRVVIEASCAVSQSNSKFCALDNTDFYTVRTAIGAPTLTKPSPTLAPATAAPKTLAPVTAAPKTLAPATAAPPKTMAPVTAAPATVAPPKRTAAPAPAPSVSVNGQGSVAKTNAPTLPKSIFTFSPISAHSTTYRFVFSSVSEQTLDTGASTDMKPTDAPADVTPDKDYSGGASLQDSSATQKQTFTSSPGGISLIVIVSIAIASSLAAFAFYRHRQQGKLKPQALQVRVSAQI